MIWRPDGEDLLASPLHAQRWSADGAVNVELRRALTWWDRVLRSGLTERRVWRGPQRAPLHVFCDASSRDARLGAVLWHTGVWYWTSMITPAHIQASFCMRNDGQIMALELLAISLALKTFELLISDRLVIVHCDNKGAESALRRGCAKRPDHARLVHAQWFEAAIMGL